MTTVGLYCVPYRALEVVADLGFDRVQDYGHGWWTSTGEAVAYFDKCEKLGLSVLCSLPLSMVRDHPGPDPEALQRAWRQIMTLGAHPALAAWYLLDEPETTPQPARGALLTQARRQYQDLTDLMPHRLIVTATCSWYRHLLPYRWPGDVLFCSTYAVRQYWPFGAYQLPAIWAGLAARHARPIVPVIGIHDADLWWCRPYRTPNEYEMRWMCYWAKRYDEVWFFGGVLDDAQLPCGDPRYYKPDWDVTRPGQQANFRRWMRYLGR